MLSNPRRNIMGTTSFDGQFNGMRKSQEFIVYPMADHADFARIQSDTRIGLIKLDSGTVTLSRPKASGAYMVHLNGAQIVGRLNAEELLLLKSHIFGSAHGRAGTNGVVYCDNSGAIEVFGSTT